MLGWSQFPVETSGSCCLPRCMCDTWTGCSHSPHQKWASHRAGGKTGPSFSFLEHLHGPSQPECSSSQGCRDSKGLHMMECKCTYRELVTNKKFIYVLEQTLRYLPLTANRFPALLFKKKQKPRARKWMLLELDQLWLTVHGLAELNNCLSHAAICKY